MSAALQPFLFVALAIAVTVVMYLRGKRARAQVQADYAQSTAGAMAHRLGFELVRGNPNSNLQISDKGAFERQSEDILLTGTPYGVPMEIIYRRKVEDVAWENKVRATWDCRVAARMNANLGRFEIRLRNPDRYMRVNSFFEDEDALGQRRFSDPTLESALRVEADDPALPDRIAAALGPLVSMTYVHIVGEGGRVSFDMSRAEHGQAIGAATGFHYIEPILHILACAVCALEGRAAPGRVEAA